MLEMGKVYLLRRPVSERVLDLSSYFAKTDIHICGHLTAR